MVCTCNLVFFRLAKAGENHSNIKNISLSFHHHFQRVAKFTSVESDSLIIGEMFKSWRSYKTDLEKEYRYKSPRIDLKNTLSLC